MSLGTELVRAVQKEAAMQRPLPMHAVAESTSLAGQDVEAKVILTDNDRFSHMAKELKVRASEGKTTTPSTPQVAAKAAQKKAEQFCKRATYLTEALQYVENDANGKAIVRSTPQTMRAPRAEYFEAKVGAHEISLKRYKANASKPGRDEVPFCVTDETLERLTNDAAGVLTGK
jgi:hypothetical protein